MIWIWMGEKEADPALIPDFSIPDPDPKKVSVSATGFSWKQATG
jgi:phenylpropionate dioxygenase-like ring-hydroxylating dioxygenase large terminal subunit